MGSRWYILRFPTKSETALRHTWGTPEASYVAVLCRVRIPLTGLTVETSNPDTHLVFVTNRRFNFGHPRPPLAQRVETGRWVIEQNGTDLLSAECLRKRRGIREEGLGAAHGPPPLIPGSDPHFDRRWPRGEKEKSRSIVEAWHWARSSSAGWRYTWYIAAQLSVPCHPPHMQPLMLGTLWFRQRLLDEGGWQGRALIYPQWYGAWVWAPNAPLKEKIFPQKEGCRQGSQ